MTRGNAGSTMTHPPAEAAPREIIVEADAWERTPFTPGLAVSTAEQAIKAACEELALKPGVGFAILLTDDTALQVLNRDYRSKDRPTNVLSFPAFEPDELPEYGHIGDIAIALETVLAESSEAHIRPEHHLAHMVVHGLAHLAGFDHVDDAEAEEMEALEVRALARMGIANPYLSSDEE